MAQFLLILLEYLLVSILTITEVEIMIILQYFNFRSEERVCVRFVERYFYSFSKTKPKFSQLRVRHRMQY
jgi:hypothetical protein